MSASNHAYNAIRCFEENIRRVGNVKSQPENYYLFKGLINMAKAVEELADDIEKIRRGARGVASRADRRGDDPAATHPDDDAGHRRRIAAACDGLGRGRKGSAAACRRGDRRPGLRVDFIDTARRRDLSFGYAPPRCARRLTKAYFRTLVDNTRAAARKTCCADFFMRIHALVVPQLKTHALPLRSQYGRLDPVLLRFRLNQCQQLYLRIVYEIRRDELQY